MNDEDKSGATQAAPEQKTKREKSTLVKVLPTDRIAFDRQVDILRAYAACYESNGGKPVSNEEAGDTLTPKFSAATLGVAVPFFTDIGLITRSEGKFVPSSELLAYNQAVVFSVAEAKRKIRPIIENAWFCRLLAPRLRLASQSFNDCVGILAVESKAGPEHRERIEPLIKFLELGGIVSIVGHTVSFIPSSGIPEKTDAEKVKEAIEKGEVPKVFSLNQKSSLYLDKSREREVTLDCPFSIKKTELERIYNWIKATWIIEEEEG
jgi:hypothetical protein